MPARFSIRSRRDWPRRSAEWEFPFLPRCSDLPARSCSASSTCKRARRRTGSIPNSRTGSPRPFTTLVLSIIFLLSIFVIVQFYLTQEVTGKDTALSRLTAQIAQLTELLSLEKTGKLDLEEQLTLMRSSLARAEGERDRYKGLFEGTGSGEGKAAELSGQLDAERRLSARALAQVEVLNQQIAALRRQLSALEEALDASEKRDKEAQNRIADLGQRLNGAPARFRSSNTLSARASHRSGSSPPALANSSQLMPTRPMTPIVATAASSSS